MSKPKSGTSTRTMNRFLNDIHQGDAAAVLREMPESSVHMAMCSPPYYGLRDYGVDGQIGLEDSLDEYIQSLVEVSLELKRVLRPDGSWWLNLGDSFAGSGGAGGQWTEESHGSAHYSGDGGDSYNGPLNESNLRRKTKMLVPHRTAIALQNAGWIVRSDAVWAKPNPMPHPVKDRLHEHKEFLFHLTPEPQYYFDLDAVREPHQNDSLTRNKYAFRTAGSSSAEAPDESRPPGEISIDADDACHPNGKNPGDIFEIPVRAFPEAHFAVYPPELCEKPIKSTCPEGGIVLDPFAGAGTTCLVAKRLDRQFIGIDLNPDYVALAQKRVGVTVDEPERLLDDGEQPLTAFTDGGSQ